VDSLLAFEQIINVRTNLAGIVIPSILPVIIDFPARASQRMTLVAAPRLNGVMRLAQQIVGIEMRCRRDRAGWRRRTKEQKFKR
jgi:hypothetical protein